VSQNESKTIWLTVQYSAALLSTSLETGDPAESR